MTNENNTQNPLQENGFADGGDGTRPLTPERIQRAVQQITDYFMGSYPQVFNWARRIGRDLALRRLTGILPPHNSGGGDETHSGSSRETGSGENGRILRRREFNADFAAAELRVAQYLQEQDPVWTYITNSYVPEGTIYGVDLGVLRGSSTGSFRVDNVNHETGLVQMSRMSDWEARGREAYDQMTPDEQRRWDQMIDNTLHPERFSVITNMETFEALQRQVREDYETVEEQNMPPSGQDTTPIADEVRIRNIEEQVISRTIEIIRNRGATVNDHWGNACAIAIRDELERDGLLEDYVRLMGSLPSGSRMANVMNAQIREWATRPLTPPVASPTGEVDMSPNAPMYREQRLLPYFILEDQRSMWRVVDRRWPSIGDVPGMFVVRWVDPVPVTRAIEQVDPGEFTRVEYGFDRWYQGPAWRVPIYREGRGISGIDSRIEEIVMRVEGVGCYEAMLNLHWEIHRDDPLREGTANAEMTEYFRLTKKAFKLAKDSAAERNGNPESTRYRQMMRDWNSTEDKREAVLKSILGKMRL